MPLRGANGPLPDIPPFPRAQREAAHGKFPDRGLTIGTKLVVPVGLALSCIAHLAFLTPAVMFGGGYPFDRVPADAVMVDIVSSEEVDEASKQEDSKQEASNQEDTKQEATPSFTVPSFTVPSFDANPSSPAASSQPAAPSPQPQSSGRPPQAQSLPAARASGQGRTRSAEPAAPSPPAWLPQMSGAAEPDPEPAQSPAGDITTVFAMPLTLPDGTVGGRYDSQAVDRADISNDSVAAFRNHLKTCSTLPAGMAPGVKVVVRVYLKPDGSLAGGLAQNPEPVKVEGVSIGGGALFQSAVAALRKCQPYKMLPPDRYEQWKSLDLTFTPQNF